MKFEASNWYHVYNQGNNRQPIFYETENYLFFLNKIRKLPREEFNIIAYCLMPNHFHFLIYTDFAETKENEISRNYSRKLGSALSSYTKAMNRRYNRTGSLFREGTKAKCLTADGQYIRTCFHYIHQNPLKAKLADSFGDWVFSSYKDYAGKRNGTIPNIKKGMEMFGYDSTQQFIEASKAAINPKMIEHVF